MIEIARESHQRWSCRRAISPKNVKEIQLGGRRPDHTNSQQLSLLLLNESNFNFVIFKQHSYNLVQVYKVTQTDSLHSICV